MPAPINSAISSYYSHARQNGVIPEHAGALGALEVITDLTPKRTDRFKTDLEDLLGDKSGDTSLVDDILALARETVPLPHQSVAELPKRGLPAGDIADILEELVALGLCSRGFSIDCAECQMESYIEHSAVTPQATCPGCGAAGAYRAAANKPAGPVVRYRLNSLLDRANDNGAPPHILGMACLRQHAAGRPLYILPGALLSDGNTDLGEVDVLGYLAEHLIAGEVKTSPEDFTEDQIKKDLSLAARIGADISVMGRGAPAHRRTERYGRQPGDRPGMPAAHLLRWHRTPA